MICKESKNTFYISPSKDWEMTFGINSYIISNAVNPGCLL